MYTAAINRHVMTIRSVIQLLEEIAPPVLQEPYDNAGLLTGHAADSCTGVLVCLDVTEAVVEEAVAKRCNLVIAHHPVIFKGLKSLTGKSSVERTVIAAIRHHIALYAIHTNLDNVMQGVNGRIARQLGLLNTAPLLPLQGALRKLCFYVPADHADAVRDAVFSAGAGQVGAYRECSFNSNGTGTFLPGPGTQPFTGQQGIRHSGEETRIEMIFQYWKESAILEALFRAHPYEEVAYEIYPLNNRLQEAGSGLIGELPAPLAETDFLQLLKTTFSLPLVRHTLLRNQPIRKVAVCGGAGSFLTGNALRAGADAFVTADLKYHEFFDAENRLLLADIGHYESEQFTIDLIFDVLKEKYPTFAVLKTDTRTNPVYYFY